ncbi:MAG: hypothetical protein U9N01_04400 [Euryarchaeota archaeon]|nr:hypothetical protein [Euryarchaeota archaeon]
MSEGKGRLSARGLDENVVEEFRRFVSDRYGKLHTVFGQELQKAMVAYLENEHTHTHKIEKEKIPPESVGFKRLLQAEQAIENSGLMSAIENGGGVYPDAVKKVMSASVGLDHRTLNKYFDAFCSRHDLSISSTGALEIY